jgi:ZIP family zinc transporter
MSYVPFEFLFALPVVSGASTLPAATTGAAVTSPAAEASGISTETFIAALLLTSGAGLATTIGSFLGLVVKTPGKRFLGFTLGFSAGVMIHVSFVELLAGAITEFEEHFRVSRDSAAAGGNAFLWAHVAFFVGMIAYFLIDVFTPHEYLGQHDHPDGPAGHEFTGSHEHPGTGTVHDHETATSLRRTGVLVALGIGIHNFPEGMATFAGTIKSVDVGIAIAVAIAIHNIPEGLAVSVPVYAATGSRLKAFWWSFLSGVSEPVGALLAGLVLLPFIQNPIVMASVLAGVGGIMVAISLDELLPSAKAFGSEHTPIIGAISGAAVMALSLYLLQ